MTYRHLERINVHGAAGGVGCTTVALALALRLGATGRTVSLTALDPEPLRAMTGRGSDDPLRDLGSGVNAPDEWEPDVTIYDAGRSLYRHPVSGRSANLLVLRNSYDALRRVVRNSDVPYDAAVLFEEEHRAIDAGTADQLLPFPVVIQRLDVRLARRQDAGVYARWVLDGSDAAVGWVDRTLDVLGVRSRTDA